MINKKTTKMVSGELPLDTLNMSDLLLQFKVMKALNYNSLFDERFRREMKNPARRLLYYRLVLLDELADRKFLVDALYNVGDKIGFYANPEIYNKVKQEERKHRMINPETSAIEVKKAQKKYKDSLHKHVPISDEELRRKLGGVVLNKFMGAN